MPSLNPISASDAVEQIWLNLDHVVRYGLAGIDRLDAEKIVAAHQLAELLRVSVREERGCDCARYQADQAI